MNRRPSHKHSTIALAILLLASSAGAAVAQSNPPPGEDDANETGDENEFGAIKVPYQVKMNGQEVLIEARIVVKDMYADQDATYFMFAVDTKENPALYAEVSSLQTASGEDIEVFDKQEEAELVQWFVDVESMPAEGTEIVFKYMVGSTQPGFFQVGALLMPFNYRWEQVTMSDDEPAKIYGATQVGVNKATKAGSGSNFKSPLGGGDDDESALPVPGMGVILAAVAIAGVALVAGTRRRRG